MSEGLGCTFQRFRIVRTEDPWEEWIPDGQRA